MWHGQVNPALAFGGTSLARGFALRSMELFWYTEELSPLHNVARWVLTGVDGGTDNRSLASRHSFTSEPTLSAEARFPHTGFLCPLHSPTLLRSLFTLCMQVVELSDRAHRPRAWRPGDDVNGFPFTLEDTPRTLYARYPSQTFLN